MATALRKIVRVLPESLASAVRAVGEVSTAYQQTGPRVDPEAVAALVQAASAGRRVRIGYAPEARSERPMEIDPWAVVLRRQRWYVLGWSHTVDARRVLRIDRVGSVRELADTFEAPPDLDPFAVVDQHLSEGWAHDVELVVDAPPADVARFLPRTHGRLEPWAVTAPGWRLHQRPGPLRRPTGVPGRAVPRRGARRAPRGLPHDG